MELHSQWGKSAPWAVWTLSIQWAKTALYLLIGQGPACGCTAQAQGKYKSDSKGQVFYRHQGKVFAKVGKQMFYHGASSMVLPSDFSFVNLTHFRLWARVFFNKLIYMYFPNGQVLKKGHWINITWFCARKLSANSHVCNVVWCEQTDHVSMTYPTPAHQALGGKFKLLPRDGSIHIQWFSQPPASGAVYHTHPSGRRQVHRFPRCSFKLMYKLSSMSKVNYIKIPHKCSMCKRYYFLYECSMVEKWK